MRTWCAAKPWRKMHGNAQCSTSNLDEISDLLRWIPPWVDEGDKSDKNYKVVVRMKGHPTSHISIALLRKDHDKKAHSQ